MVQNFEFGYFFHGIHDLLQTGIAKFGHRIALGANHMVVLFVVKRFLVLRLRFSKLVFSHQVAIQKQFDGVVQGGSTHPVIFIFHFDVQGLDIKMFLLIVDLFQDGKSLGSFSLTILFQIGRKDLFYSLLYFINFHCRKNAEKKGIYGNPLGIS